jgi:hypothetical protein
MLPSISKDSNLLIPKDSKNRKPVTGYATEAFKSLKKLFGFKQSESSSGQCHCPNKAYTQTLKINTKNLESLSPQHRHPPLPQNPWK